MRKVFMTEPNAPLVPQPIAEPAVPDEAGIQPTLGTRLTTIVVVIVPFLGLVAAIALLWGRGFSWVELGLLLGMYAVTALGVTIGFHRLFSHRAFEANPVVQYILAICGSMSIQAPLLKWVAVHRLHHQHSDGHDDPHSPHHY